MSANAIFLFIVPAGRIRDESAPNPKTSQRGQPHTHMQALDQEHLERNAGGRYKGVTYSKKLKMWEVTLQPLPLHHHDALPPVGVVSC
jgi:hypothetical protein